MAVEADPEIINFAAEHGLIQMEDLESCDLCGAFTVKSKYVGQIILQVFEARILNFL